MLGGQIELDFIAGKENSKCLNQSSIYTFGDAGCFGEGRVEMGDVTHLSCALIYPKGKDLGIILLLQRAGYRVLLRSS